VATLIEGMGHIGMVVALAKPFDRDRRVADAVFAFLAEALPPAPVPPSRVSAG
jgi:hypothetical protein